METSSALFELATVSLACRDRDTFLKNFSTRIGGELGAKAVLVWTVNPAAEEIEFVCGISWAHPGEHFTPSEERVRDGLLSEACASTGARRITPGDFANDDFSHLDETSRGHVRSGLYAQIPGVGGPEGVIEVLNKRSGEFTAEDGRFLEEAARIAGQVLTNLAGIESERQSNFAALERLTSLYDLGRTFTSTLELEELLPIVAGKIRDILGAGACNLWLADAGELRFAQQAGEDPSVEEGATAPLEEDLFGELMRQGVPKLIEDATEEAQLEKRRRAAADLEIATWMAAPLRKDDEILGVVEVINKADGGRFNDEDLFFLTSISEQAATALHNAKLLESERKLHTLDALLKISQEITSTLDLDHVLTTVVQQAGSIIPFDRCVIGFFDRGRFVLGAVSGEEEVPKTREMQELRERLEWAAEEQENVWADRYEDGWHVGQEATNAQFVPFLEAHEYNGLYILPLRDEQGTLGAMSLLSGDADFLTASNKETLAILANQTTVAIRNAQLYQQVPLANLLQPLAQRKQRLLAAVPQGRWRTYAERIAAVAAILFVIPWPLRVGTDATVVPAQRRVVSSIQGGIVRQVFVREGESVREGQVLAQLDASDDRVKLARAEAALAQTERALSDAEFHNDPAAASDAKIQSDVHRAEVAFENQRIEEAQLRSPIAGTIVTPKVEEKAGTMLQPGGSFCEVVAQDEMAAEMSVPETDLPLLKPGNHVSLKLNAYPETTFEGVVERIGAQTKSDSGEQYFLVRAIFRNTGDRARDGMAGRARVRAGGGWFRSQWHPIGYVILRAPFRWIWEKAWSWLP
ncbi:MAG TPA: efflux RND transporter periplasmic adaptor subunit [Candidatus Acidoferrales bacterium]|nr:efflux RND transporter periplasmic adaptor subunit [Candidatus Acidoferrales bacterium]